MLIVDNIHAGYGSSEVLQGASLQVQAGKVVALIGANGASYEEAAEVIGCAIGTIKSRLARGRKALAALIDGPPEDSQLEPVA